jgi:SagB-type dehydrogenase family enzyme
VRSYGPGPLKLAELSQLLWAAQGITDERGGRTAPSAGATYPLELIVVVGSVDELSPGVYRYDPSTHSLKRTAEGDLRDKLAAASLGQASVRTAAVDIVIAAVYERTTARYGERGERFVHLEAGHAAQNVCLEATALGLGVVTVGAFDDGQVAELVGLSESETPLYVIPVGKKG